MSQTIEETPAERDPTPPIILPSTHSTPSREAALVYFSGALVDPKHCVELARGIQAAMAAAGTALHVALPAAPSFSPAYFTLAGQQPMAHAMLDASLAALEERCGFRPTPQSLFLGGHSFGSILATCAALHDPGAPVDSIAEAAHGLCIVIHGGYIRPEYNSLKALRAAPTAEINGDRDGLIRLNNFAERRALIDENVPDAAERVRIAPVAILPGVSHTSFCDGATTPYVAPRDTPPTVRTADGTAAIADATAKFMLLSDPESPADAVRAAAAFFEESTQRAATGFLDVYRDALARDKAGDTCRDAQQVLLGLKPCAGAPIEPQNPEDTGFTEDQVSVLQPRVWNTLPPADPETPALEHDWPFLSSKPKIFTEGGSGGADNPDSPKQPPSGRVAVWPQSSLALRSDEISALTSSLGAPTKLRCKLKSGHAVAAALGAGTGIAPGGPTDDPPPPRPSAPPSGSTASPTAAAASPDLREEFERLDPFTAARINEHVVRSVLSRLPQHVRELYERSPRRLAFGPDLDAPQAPDWSVAELTFADLLEGGGGGGGGTGDAWRPPAESGGVVLRSPRFTMPPGEGRFMGMFYCTIISEAQAFEYILYESQKGAGIEVDEEGVLLCEREGSAPAAAPSRDEALAAAL